MSKISKGCKKTHLNNTEPAVAAADPELAGAEAAEGVAAGKKAAPLWRTMHSCTMSSSPPLVVVALAFLAGNIATILLVF
jgi:hypothetical protein